MSLELLLRLLEALKHTSQSYWDYVLFATLFVLAYHGALRISECATVPRSNHTVKMENVTQLYKGRDLIAYQMQLESHKHSEGQVKPIRFVRQ